jgi:hypothetical protein
MPKAERPYRVWGYPYVPSLAIFGMLILLVVTFMNSFEASMLGIFVILIGNGFYDVFMDKLGHEPAVSPSATSVEVKSIAKEPVTKKTNKK